MILDGEADGNRTGSDPEPLIILSTLADGADIAEIAEILRSKELRNQGKEWEM